jgi:adenosylcobinamide-phosphate synthase
MAAMAGLLGVALEKRGHYRLGDPVRPLAPASIASAWRVVVLASVLALAIVVAIATVAGAGATALPGPGPGQGRIDGR